MFAVITPVLLLIAFLLLLLVTLSTPIIKPILLFRLTANLSSSLFQSDANGSVNFGLWGYCISTINFSIAKLDHNREAQCSKVHLGYNLDKDVVDALHVDSIQNLISHTTTTALVLHPISTGLVFLTFLLSLFLLRRGPNRLLSLVTLGVGITAAMLTAVVFLIDVIFVAVVRHKVKNASDGDLVLNWGNAVWMVLGATIAVWLSMIGACAGICACGNRGRTHKTDRY